MVAVAIVAQRVNKNGRSRPHTRKKDWILMKSRQISDKNGERTFVLIYEAGEAFHEPLVSLANQNHLGASQFTAIGAFRAANIGYFDREQRDYIKFTLREQVEVLTLNGNITLSENLTPKIHAHVILGRKDASVRGGHLFDAEVWPTLELVLTESPQYLRRRFNPEIGLALLEV